MKIVIQ